MPERTGQQCERKGNSEFKSFIIKKFKDLVEDLPSVHEAPGSIPNTEKTNKPKLTIMKASHREPNGSGSEQGWPGKWTVVND